MINIAICDNDTNDLENVISCIRSYFSRHTEYHGQLYKYHSAEELLKDVPEKDFLIYFLDVLMPEMDGIELGKRIRQEKENNFVTVQNSIS